MPLLYRGHAAFLFTSRYEAWGLPVMEAMASGLPVVATRCLGLAAFAEHGFNCLLADAQVRRQMVKLLLWSRKRITHLRMTSDGAPATCRSTERLPVPCRRVEPGFTLHNRSRGKQ